MRYQADVVVKLKNGVRDPQGSALETVLKRIQLEENPKIQVGKFFTIEIEGIDEKSAREKLEKIAFEALSNPVLEIYEIKRFETL